MGAGEEFEREEEVLPRKRYFENALSDFVYDMASGANIRHLVDRGYSISQIKEKLDYPAPKERLQESVWRHMLETGLVVLDFSEKCSHDIEVKSRAGFLESVRKIFSEYGEENVYVYCTCEKWIGGGRGSVFKCKSLTSRERDYITELPWPEDDGLCHRLNGKMLEIITELAENGEEIKIVVPDEGMAYSVRCRRK